MTIEETRVLDATSLAATAATAVAEGGRLAGLYATTIGVADGRAADGGARDGGARDGGARDGGARDGGADLVRLTALLVHDGQLRAHDATVAERIYPSLTRTVPAAFWYERAIHDLHGIIPGGHPRLDPLLLPLPGGAPRPRPGAPVRPGPLVPDEHVVTRRVLGSGLFTIPHGPVRSGVMESVEYLVETPGEDIPFLRLRPYYKHRGVERRFEGATPLDGVLVAERVEGIATVAHATAYAHAIEDLAGVRVPEPACYVRTIHAELERLANHLEVIVRLAEAGGLAVAVARFGWHKERVLRLVGGLCGSRFGRGVVVPGGVTGPPRLPRGDLRAEIGRLRGAAGADIRLLMRTSSFLDRLRRTGPLPPDAARSHGALGPVGRGSGIDEDLRVTPGYGAYPALGARAATGFDTGDALARLRVRIAEIDESLRLIDEAADRLAGGPLATPIEAADVPDGRGIGRAEAPQGEVVYAIDVEGGRITRCWPRSASFHNMAVFGNVFVGDIFTDFPFTEASFGASIAGVAL